MPLQAPQWTEFLSCPVCYNVFNETMYRPISLACGHTVCRTCLSKFQQSKCPFDQSVITRDVKDLPVNFALLQLVCATACPNQHDGLVEQEYRKYYKTAQSCVEELALLLKPVSSSSTGSIITVPPASGSGSQPSSQSPCVLSRPMQRKLITLVNCQLVEEEGRARALRASRSLGERTVTELILQHQNPQQLSSNLWAAVRGRGCQFLGPGMQEEVLKLILLALEDGSALSRKVLVLFVVQRLESQYPQASKTAIGHVVQLLYRASCFKVTKRDEESSLMQLKEELRTYDMLRREHDSQIVQIAMEAGLRIAPDQWSSLLYGDSTHKSHMQSIIDKLQTPQTFSQSVSELLIALQRTSDPHDLQRLRPQLEFLSSIDPSPDVPCPSWENLGGVITAVKTVIEGLVQFLQNCTMKKHEFLTPFNVRYKTSMCRDQMEVGSCPRGASCSFAHSEEELERYRQRNKRMAKGMGCHDQSAPAMGSVYYSNRGMENNRYTGDGYDVSRTSKTYHVKSRGHSYSSLLHESAACSQSQLASAGGMIASGMEENGPSTDQASIKSLQTAIPPSPSNNTKPPSANLTNNAAPSSETSPRFGNIAKSEAAVAQPLNGNTIVQANDVQPMVSPVDGQTVLPAYVVPQGSVILENTGGGNVGALLPPDSPRDVPVVINAMGMPQQNMSSGILASGNIPIAPQPGTVPLATPGMFSPGTPAVRPQGAAGSHAVCGMMGEGSMPVGPPQGHPGGPQMMPPGMGPMPAMMSAYMPPYGAAGGPMMDARGMGMPSMMYGPTYPYPMSMPPHLYMHYHHDYMHRNNANMQCDNYYTALNPSAEPWNPTQSMAGRYTSSENCSICCHKQEQQRLQHLQNQQNQHQQMHEQCSRFNSHVHQHNNGVVHRAQNGQAPEQRGISSQQTGEHQQQYSCHGNHSQYSQSQQNYNNHNCTSQDDVGHGHVQEQHRCTYHSENNSYSKSTDHMNQNSSLNQEKMAGQQSAVQSRNNATASATQQMAQEHNWGPGKAQKAKENYQENSSCHSKITVSQAVSSEGMHGQEQHWPSSSAQNRSGSTNTASSKQNYSIQKQIQQHSYDSQSGGSEGNKQQQRQGSAGKGNTSQMQDHFQYITSKAEANRKPDDHSGHQKPPGERHQGSKETVDTNMDYYQYSEASQKQSWTSEDHSAQNRYGMSNKVYVSSNKALTSEDGHYSQKKWVSVNDDEDKTSKCKKLTSDDGCGTSQKVMWTVDNDSNTSPGKNWSSTDDYMSQSKDWRSDDECQTSQSKKWTSDDDYQSSQGKKWTSDDDYQSSQGKKWTSDNDYQSSQGKKWTSNDEYQSSQGKKWTSDDEYMSQCQEWASMDHHSKSGQNWTVDEECSPPQNQWSTDDGYNDHSEHNWTSDDKYNVGQDQNCTTENQYDDQQQWLSEQSAYHGNDGSSSQSNGNEWYDGAWNKNGPSQKEMPSTGKGKVSKNSRRSHLPMPMLREPNAQFHRQSLVNLQERRDSLLAQLHELNNEEQEHRKSISNMSKEILPNLFRYESVPLEKSPSFQMTLKHPLPVDMGPTDLKSTYPTNGEIFERLSALSGIPPRSVNDSIMASWTTSSLKDSTKRPSFVSDSDSFLESIQIPSSGVTGTSSSSSSSSSQQQTSTKKTETAWRDEDFPYWKDVSQTIKSPITTPPSTPSPDSVHPASMSYTSMTPGVSYSTMSNVMRMSSYSSVPPSLEQSSYQSRPRSTASITASTSFNHPAASWTSSNMSQANSSNCGPQSSSSYSVYNSGSNMYSSGAPDVYAGPASSTRTNYTTSVLASVSQEASYTPSYRKSVASSWLSPLSFSDSQGQDTVVSFFSAGNEEEHIPFQEGKPTISKFGPISRAKFGHTMVKAGQPVKAVADEMMKTVPVTAVTPLSVPPLPNTQMVPSRFRTLDDNLCDVNPMPEDGSYEKSYSLWTTEINLLEQKAKDANTEDEKLTVKLKAVEMQITLKEQELLQAHAVQQAQCEASEYMKRQQQENNTQHSGSGTLINRLRAAQI